MSLAVRFRRRNSIPRKARNKPGGDRCWSCRTMPSIASRPTVLAIPLTTNLRRASLPSCVQVTQGDGGLTSDSVILCHQMRALDKSRLKKRLGVLSDAAVLAVEARLLFTLGIS